MKIIDLLSEDNPGCIQIPVVLIIYIVIPSLIFRLIFWAFGFRSGLFAEGEPFTMEALFSLLSWLIIFGYLFKRDSKGKQNKK